MAEMPKSEVRGLWFTTARRYILERGGETWLEAMADRVERPYKAAILEPDANEWYPERALQQSLGAMHHVITGGDDSAFVDVIEECTILGINLFFRLMMRLGSPTMVIRRAPAMWNHIRRGAGTVTVETHDGGALLRFGEFPLFRDPHYRLLTLGATRALVTVCGRPRPTVSIEEHHFDRLVVRVTYSH
jgi:hypothetical protein